MMEQGSALHMSFQLQVSISFASHSTLRLVSAPLKNNGRGISSEIGTVWGERPTRNTE